MPKFKYAAVDATGATVEGVAKGETIGAVRQILKQKDLVPIRIVEHRGRLDLEVTTEKLSKKELMHFSRQLAVFVRSGIPIIDSLDTIAEEAQDRVLRKVITSMTDQLRQGSTFSSAAKSHPEAFPAYYLGVLESAELTGNLDDTLDKLASYIDRDLQSRSRITAALMYPSVVVVMSMGTVAILAGFVLPKFKDLFAELNADLPLATRALLAFASLFTDLWFIPVIGFLLTGVSVAFLMSARGKPTRDRLVLRLPVVKGIVNYSILERFCRVLSAMLEAGVPLPEAMRVTIESTSNVEYVSKLVTAREQMMEGGGFTGPLSETDLFPGAARQMFRVGEETGTLDAQLETAAHYFDRELAVRVQRFVGMFEPAMILFVGGVVGFVAIALVQAMYGVLGGMQ
ncbi:MAG: type II secretion system F family protein [Ilumatobacteraceae bacterium]